jgi:hypothetical protein
MSSVICSFLLSNSFCSAFNLFKLLLASSNIDESIHNTLVNINLCCGVQLVNLKKFHGTIYLISSAFDSSNCGIHTTLLFEIIISQLSVVNSIFHSGIVF